MSAAPAILLLTRDLLTADPEMPTLGEFTADGLMGPIYTLEDPWKNNAPNISCIPEGEYPLVYVWSNRLKKFTPRLLNVPGRSGILVHGGDVAADTEGCILAAIERGADGRSIHNCPPAIRAIVRWLIAALAAGLVIIRIARTPVPLPSPAA